MSPTSEMSVVRDLGVIVRALRLRILLVVGSILFAIALACMHILTSPKIYAATAVIQVEQEEQKVINIEGMKSEDLKALEIIKTFEQSITSPEVLLRVLQNSKLANKPDFLPEVAIDASPSLRQEALGKHIEAKIRRGTRLIDITVRHQVPIYAKEIAQQIIHEFSQWNFEMERQAAQLANEFLLKEAKRLKVQLRASEEAVQKYRVANAAVSLDDKQTIISENLKALSLRVATARADRLKLEADCDQLKNFKSIKPSDLLHVTGVASSPAVLELTKSIAERETRFAALQERYKAEHPKFAEAKFELEKLKSELDRAVMGAAENLTSSYLAAKETEHKLQEALRQQEKAALELNQIYIPYAALVRDLESDRAIFESVLTRLKQTDVTKDISQDAIRIVTYPLVPHRPIKPKATFLLTVSVIAGSILGCGLALGLYMIDPSLQTYRDAEARLGIRFLGAIPEFAFLNHADGSVPSLLDPHLSVIDVFEPLCASLLAATENLGEKAILFTSVAQLDGKSFTAANCAIWFAQSGMKTLLIGADSHPASLRKSISSPDDPEKIGAQGEVSATTLSKLDFMSLEAGDSNFDPHAAASQFQFLVQQVRPEFDRVIIDSSSINVARGVFLHCRHVKAVCLVLRAQVTHLDDAREAIERITAAGATVIGFVWNAGPNRRARWRGR